MSFYRNTNGGGVDPTSFKKIVCNQYTNGVLLTNYTLNDNYKYVIVFTANNASGEQYVYVKLNSVAQNGDYYDVSNACAKHFHFYNLKKGDVLSVRGLGCIYLYK